MVPKLRQLGNRSRQAIHTFDRALFELFNASSSLPPRAAK